MYLKRFMSKNVRTFNLNYEILLGNFFKKFFTFLLMKLSIVDTFKLSLTLQNH